VRIAETEGFPVSRIVEDHGAFLVNAETFQAVEKGLRR
jgi:hypothetical protein